MRRNRIFLISLLLILISVLLAACGGGDRPSAPRGVEVEYDTLTLRWDEVEGARLYTVSVQPASGEGEEIAVSKNFYSLESLPVGEYTLTVCAEVTGVGVSDPSREISFVREAECGLVFTLKGGEYEVTSVGTAEGNISVPATYRRRAVTAIGDKAFFNCTALTGVSLPEGIRSIGDFAFAGCAYLENIELPKELKNIGESAFSGCRALGGGLSLPEGITVINKGTFAYCSSLEWVELSGEAVEIRENAFTDCSRLKSVSLPEGLRSIGGFAFAACADLEKIILPEGLRSIGEFAFSKAVSLSEIAIPDSVTSVGKGAFYHCTALASVTLGGGVEELGDSAFLDTPIYEGSVTNEIYVGDWFIGLKDTTVPVLNLRAGTVGIANNALYANQLIGAVELPDSVRFIGSHAFAVSNIVSIVTGKGVERIADQAFLYCERLIDVALGSYDYVDKVITDSSLKYIGNYAFMNCTRLERIEIPDTVTDIGSYAFRNSGIYQNALSGAVYADRWVVDYNKTITEELTVDPGTVGIARYSFYGCSELKKITIDNSVKYISKGAFYNCPALEWVSLPDGLVTLPDYCFYSCSSLTPPTLPPALEVIGRAAFYGCFKQDRRGDDTADDILELPSSVRWVGDYAFFGCGSAEADALGRDTETVGPDILVIGDRVEYIGKCAFRGFASLREVRAVSVYTIGEKAFYECRWLESFTLTGRIDSIGDKAFCHADRLTEAHFPNTLRGVGAYAFYGCESLAAVNLGASLEYIGEYAFYGNRSLRGLTLPETLHSIGEQAFRGCLKLGSLTLSKGVGYIGAHAFYSCPDMTLYLEEGISTGGYNALWNSNFATLVYGCEIGSDGYAVSVSGRVENLLLTDNLSAPSRDGMSFLGFALSEGGELLPITALTELNGDGRLYAVYGPPTE